MAKELINKVRAKIAARIVQMQSVHLRSFSSTGKFRNVYTLFLNMSDKILFQYCINPLELESTTCPHNLNHTAIQYLLQGQVDTFEKGVMVRRIGHIYLIF